MMKNATFLFLFIFFFVTYNGSHAQSFNLQLADDSICIGNPGKELVVYATITNLTSSDLEIYIVRKEENLPSSWLSSMCVDVCLPPNMDSTYLYLYAGSSQNFSFHFYTGTTNDTGSALLTFRNAASVTEVYMQRFYGITDSLFSSLVEIEKSTIQIVHPNPTRSTIQVDLSQFSKNAQLSVFDAKGNQIVEFNNTLRQIYFFNLKKGLYFFNIKEKDKVYQQKVLVLE